MITGKVFNRALWVMLVLLATIVSAFIIYGKSVNRDCEVLTKISTDTVLSKEIWGKLKLFLSNPSSLERLGRKSGLVYIDELDDDLGINWSKLGIPVRNAALEIRGEDLDYRSLVSRNIEEVRVGFGYRSQLVFKLHHEPTDQLYTYTLSVECKKTNRTKGSDPNGT